MFSDLTSLADGLNGYISQAFHLTVTGLLEPNLNRHLQRCESLKLKSVINVRLAGRTKGETLHSPFMNNNHPYF